MALAASIADGLIFLTLPSADAVPVVTARVDCAVWTVQIGLVVKVVIDPATSPATIPSPVVNAGDTEPAVPLRRSKSALISSSDVSPVSTDETYRKHSKPRW